MLALCRVLFRQKWGHNVICVDVDAGKVQAPKDGTLPIYEPGFEKSGSRQLQKWTVTVQY